MLFKINIFLDFSFRKRSSEYWPFLLVSSKDKTDLFQAVSSTRAGHVLTFLKLFCSVVEQGPSARLFRSCSFFQSFCSCSILNLKCVLDNMNLFLILNILFKNFRSVPLQIVPTFLRMHEFALFSEQWDHSWSFCLFLWKNDHSPGTTPGPSKQ